MGLFGWLKRSGNGANARIETWRARLESRRRRRRRTGHRAASRGARGARRRSLDDLEIEEEMLEGLERLVTLDAASSTRRSCPSSTPRIASSAPTAVTTARRRRCPTIPPQPSGRLLLTSTRAVFIGGARLTALAWHAAAQVVLRRARPAARPRRRTGGRLSLPLQLLRGRACAARRSRVT